MASAPCVTNHTVTIHDRGGIVRLWQLTEIASIEWSRLLSQKSTATVVLNGKQCLVAQADVLNAIEPRRHEMVIWRGTERVWEGPIVDLRTTSTTATIVAADGQEYLDGTVLSRSWPITATGKMTDRFKEIITWELTQPYNARVQTGAASNVISMTRWEQQVPPANILPYMEVHPGKTLTRSATDPFQMMLGEHMAALAKSGVDFTWIGRKLLIWDSTSALSQTRILTESDFGGDVEVISSGTDFAAIGHTNAATWSENNSFYWGSAGKADPYYGPWTRLGTNDTEEGDGAGGGQTQDPTQDSLNSQAAAAIAGRNPVPIEIRMVSGGLQLSHDLTVHDLVPGILMPIQATLNIRPLSQMQMLVAVTVREDGVDETITPTLMAVGPVVEMI